MMDKKKKATFTFAFTGKNAATISERFAATFWDGGIDQHLECDFLEQYNLDCDDLLWGSYYHCIVNTNRAIVDDDKAPAKEETVVNEQEKDSFLFTFSGKKSKEIAERFAAYFWDGGFEEYLEQMFLAEHGLSSDDITYDSMYHCTIDTNGAQENYIQTSLKN